MATNNKQKLRKIIVNSDEYYWLVTRVNCDGDGNFEFKIFHQKKIIFERLTHRCITPRLVEKIIKRLT